MSKKDRNISVRVEEELYDELHRIAAEKDAELQDAIRWSLKVGCVLLRLNPSNALEYIQRKNCNGCK